jgi:hypothetical protein
MNCDRCQQTIAEGEEREHLSQILCEDCYMDALSPAKGCDPWAVHSAKTLERGQGGRLEISEIQQKILAVLEETGGIKLEALAERLALETGNLERELAALRHMEKIRAELRDGGKYIVIW